jgi:predicted Fe-Mo cluster-binding NifX family protein
MHINSFSNRKLIIGVPVIKVNDEYYLSMHFGKSPLFALVEVLSSNYRVLEIVENPYTTHKHQKGKRVIDFLLSRGVNTVIVLGIGYGAFYKLKEQGVKIYYVPAENTSRGLMPLDNVIKMFINGQLEEAREPRELY